MWLLFTQTDQKISLYLIIVEIEEARYQKLAIEMRLHSGFERSYRKDLAGNAGSYPLVKYRKNSCYQSFSLSCSPSHFTQEDRQK
jgi:hypothetical protein